MEWVYLNDAHNTCRYILGTVGCNPLVCIGVNPSIAEPNKLDNTLKSVARIAAQNGYDSWIMLNLYPQRATNPNDLHTAPNTGWMEQNTKHISQLLEKYPNAHLWAAWGNLIEKRPYLAECLYQIQNVAQNHNCQWVTFGRKSVKGHPHHPLYLKTTSPKELFDIQTYQPKKENKKRAN